MSDANGRSAEALRQIRDSFPDCLSVTADELVFRPSLEHLRGWAMLAAWGLQELSTLEEGDGPAPPAVEIMGELRPQIERLRAAVSAFRDRRGSLSDVAWEVERLDLMGETVCGRLLAHQRYREWSELLRVLDDTRAGLWKLLRRAEARR
jgi:hypothetical protein